MAQLQQVSTICPYLILGLRRDAPMAEVDNAFAALSRRLDPENFAASPQSWVQAQQAFMVIENAYRIIAEGRWLEEESSETLQEAVPLKLGQLLVAAGTISLDQLEEAIKQQSTLDLPLGEILKRSSLITQMELDAFLLKQRVLRLPKDSPYLLGQRLIGLGLLTEDMVRIALVEQRTTDKPLGEILSRRGWLAAEILEALIAVEPLAQGPCSS